MKRILFCSTALICLLSCDPMRRIAMENKTSGKATFLWTLNEQDSLWANPFFYSGSPVIKFVLDNQAPRNKVNMSFGTGSWNIAYLDDMVKKLQCLEIIRDSVTITTLDSAEKLKDYLLQRRKGLDKSKIKIVLE